MKDLTIGFIGLGLIGGSIARGIKRSRRDVRIMAYMRSRDKLEQAKRDGVVDVILDGIGEEISWCDLVFLCTPVEYNASYLEQIRPLLKPGALVTDVGSTKTDIHETVKQLCMEEVFVGGHPMAGSEKTGYENSTDHLLENAYYMITPTEKSTPEQIGRIRRVALSIGAIPMVTDYRQHDFSVAAVSHLPHLVASSLVNLVRDNDNEEELMRTIAAGGFKDITRIASSSPLMWEQICMTNTENTRYCCAGTSSLLKPYMRSWTAGMEAPSTGCLKSRAHTATPSPATAAAPWPRIIPLPWISWTNLAPFPLWPCSWPPRASTSRTSASTIAGKRARALSGSPFITRTPKPGPMSC